MAALKACLYTVSLVIEEYSLNVYSVWVCVRILCLDTLMMKIDELYSYESFTKYSWSWWKITKSSRQIVGWSKSLCILINDCIILYK